jgi:integrase
MSIRRRGRFFHGSIRVNGVYVPYRSTGCTDRKAAEAVLADWEREAADPSYAASKRATLDEACSGLLKHYSGLVAVGKRAPATESYYTEKLGTVCRVVGPKTPLSLILAAAVDAFIVNRRAELASEHTISKELDAWKLVMRWSKRAHAWAGDSKAIFPTFGKHYAPRERTLTDAEVDALLGCLTRDVGAQLAFAVATGAEAKCLLDAQRTDTATDGRYVLLRGTKRDLRWRTVPVVTARQRSLLAFALSNATGKDPFLFEHTTWALRNGLTKACKALGLAHASPNDLRRTFAVHMREAGFPLELIAPLMGHKDTRMLERVYGRLSPEQLRERLILVLNAGAACYNGVTESHGKALPAADVPTAKLNEYTEKVAPRAGFEPATHGLTVRATKPISLATTPEFVYLA